MWLDADLFIDITFSCSVALWLGVGLCTDFVFCHLSVLWLNVGSVCLQTLSYFLFAQLYGAGGKGEEGKGGGSRSMYSHHTMYSSVVRCRSICRHQL